MVGKSNSVRASWHAEDMQATGSEVSSPTSLQSVDTRLASLEFLLNSGISSRQSSDARNPIASKEHTQLINAAQHAVRFM